MSMIISLIVAAVTFGTVLMFGTLGEILTEKSGNLNLGVEGIMYMGGAFGLAGAFYYEKAAGAAASAKSADKSFFSHIFSPCFDPARARCIDRKSVLHLKYTTVFNVRQVTRANLSAQN